MLICANINLFGFLSLISCKSQKLVLVIAQFLSAINDKFDEW